MTLYCENDTCVAGQSHGYYSSYRAGTKVPKERRNVIEVAGRGRTPKYCSDACKQDAYRRRKAWQDDQAERARRIRENEQRQEQTTQVIALAITQVATKRLPTPMVRAVAEHAARALMLAGLVS